MIALTFIPVAGVAEQALASALGQAFGVGLAIGVLVSGFSHALFPDAPGPAPIAAAPRAAASPEAASWSALQATLVVMPVFVLALTNPAFYLAAIMKTVTVGQQASATNARSAGRELVGSTLMGAVMAAVVWFGLSLRPNLWMLTLWVVAAALWAGARLFRIKPTSDPPSFWVNALMTMFILLGPGHRGCCGRQGCLQGFCHPRRPVHRGSALCVGNGVGARALACLEIQLTHPGTQLERKT